MKKVLWNDGWEFAKELYDEGVLDKVPSAWTKVALPHDWLIYDTHNLYQDSIGWYKKIFNYTKANEKVVVRFEGVYMDSTVYLNGEVIGSWKYGYATFDMDLTDNLINGENELLVRVIHQSPNSRWYSGAGIYRDVWFCTFPVTHFVMDGVYITPEKVTEDTWKVLFDAEVYGAAERAAVKITDPCGNMVGCLDLNTPVKKTDSDMAVMSGQIIVHNPCLWDIGKGNVYKAEIMLWDKDGITDETVESFGFRTIDFDANKGFFINGRHEKIKGSCEHHGFSCLGAAVSKAAIKKKLLTLREMGVNAIRTAHNMPSSEFMELADEMGFLVDTESFDCWSKPKTTYDYGRFYNEWYKKDIASWVRRDRNHPSIIMWSVGNEIYDMHEGQIGYDELKALVAEVKRHDYRGHAKITFASNYMRWENAQKCAELVDLVGYNYGEYLYDNHHEAHPDWIIYGSETSSMLASRGIYHFPLDRDILCEDDEQCSALGNSFAGWGAHKYSDNIIADRDREYSLGQFIWTGFDYFGEPTPYHTRNSYFGNVDTAGFKKDAFYIYQAEWIDYKVSPMVHVFPYWDFNEGQIVDVCICSNAPEVELFINGCSVGKKVIDHKSGTELVPHWSIPYEKGEIKAIAYDENGNIVATETRHSFGEVAELVIKEEKIEDLYFYEISALDAEGYPVENANNRVKVSVSDNATLLGLDNGDSTDFDQVKQDNRKMFQGKLLAIVKVNSEADYDESNSDSLISDSLISVSLMEEVPIRKIELSTNGGLVFSPAQREIDVKVNILPDNASYDDIEVKVVNDIGIPVQSVEGVLDGDTIHLCAKGDGEFWLRVIAMNGGKAAAVRSCLKFSAKGLGQAFMNPYERINGGLCINRPQGLSEGVEQGVRFLGKELTRIYFDKMDFGKAGSRELIMELFKYTAEPAVFRIYDEDKNQLICESSFAESANWLEFKLHHIVLPETLRGIKSISIESSDNFQLRALMFTKIRRGYENTLAIDCDEIFGDSFEITDKNVENIGNNTTLVFDELDFTMNEVSTIKICGRTDLPNTTIHMKVEGEGISETELIEFAHSDEYCEREYTIKEITGNVKISFIFLPGSQFDFSCFRME